MSEAISAVDADYARVSSASLQLAAALSQERTGPDVKPGDIARGQAAVQAAQAALEQAQAALQADQAAAAAAPQPDATRTATTTTATTATGAATPSATIGGAQFVTDPGGIVA